MSPETDYSCLKPDFSKEMLEAAQKLFEDSCEERESGASVSGAQGEPGAKSTSNKLADSQGEGETQLLFDNIWPSRNS